MDLKKIRFDWSINLGALVQLGGVLVSAFIIYGSVVTFQIETRASLKEGAEARAKYIPIIEDLQSSDRMQTMQLDDTKEAIKELRQLSITNSQKLGEIATGLAVVTERLPAKE